MADYHVLESTRRDKVRVAFHIPVPDENNNVGINFQTAVSQYLTGEPTVVPWLQSKDPTEYVQLQNGEIYEYVETIEYNANSTNSEKQAVVDVWYNELVSKIPNTIRERFIFWGLDRRI